MLPEPHLSILFIRPVFRYLVRHGHELTMLHDQLGLSAAQLENDRERLPFSQVFDILEKATVISGTINIGLYVYEEFDLSDFGEIGYMLLSSNNMGDGFRAFERFVMAVDESTYLRLVEHNDSVELCNSHLDKRFLANKFDIVQTMMFLVATLRNYIDQGWKPVRVDFGFATPSRNEVQEYERVLGTEIRFNQSENRLILDTGVLNQQLPTADQNLNRMMTGVIEASLQQPKARARFLNNLRLAIEETLSRGASVDIVAKQLHTTTRSLQRKLQGLGYRYREIVGYTRYQLALVRLRNSRVSINQLAAELGYAEESGFIRAFHRWSGQTPGKIRIARV